MEKATSFYHVIVFLFISSLINAHSFNTVHVQLDSLKENPVMLNSVWRYHSGDDSTAVNTLAIRYSNQNSIVEKEWTKRWSRGVGFRVILREMNSSFAELILRGRIASGVNFGIAGLFLALSALYFFLFIFYARRIENLRQKEINKKFVKNKNKLYF